MDAINDFLAVLSSDTCRILDLFLRLIINTFFTILIARAFYFPKARRRDFFFTYILVGFCIFMLIHLMGDAKIKTGIAMGLFAIFCIMRYRTESVPIREMTYLFLIICLSVVHAMASEYIELFVIDAIVLASVMGFEMTMKIQPTKIIQYDRVELVKPDKREELKADLEMRTGLKILKIDVGGIDFLKDSVVIRITYESDNRKYNRFNGIDGQFTVKKSQWNEV